MTHKDNNTYVLVKDANGENILCPIDVKKGLAATAGDENEDCFEEDVAGRYAGNIKIRSS